MSRRALLIIDLQNDYFPAGRFPLVGIEAAAANARRVVDAGRERGDLVVHVRHESLRPGATFFAPGTPGADTHHTVLPAGDERVIVKNSTNSFKDTQLKAVLDDNGVDDVVIAGAMSHMCIDAAARAAADFGFKVTVLHDACATRDLAFSGRSVSAEDVHAAFMAGLANYATLSSTDTWLKG
ncbi:cysteine hydrolase family protein [Bradyrhizobium sp.]|uniref:cysteine hydrolase family protein n=1 Tax=Bradyrhizobium sp. TaxID=376 RepID=UPI0039E2B00B